MQPTTIPPRAAQEMELRARFNRELIQIVFDDITSDLLQRGIDKEEVRDRDARSVAQVIGVRLAPEKNWSVRIPYRITEPTVVQYKCPLLSILQVYS